MWSKYLLLATSAYNTFNTPNLANYSPYELVFGRKPKLLLNLETMPDITILCTLKDNYQLLNKRLQYLHILLQDFKSKRLAMMNEDRTFFQYNNEDLVYIMSPLNKSIITLKDNYQLLNKRLQYLHILLQDFKSKRLAMMNEDRTFFQYNNEDLVYIMSPLTSPLCTMAIKVMIKYVGPVIIYIIIDPHSYLLMTVDGKILSRFFEYKRLKPVYIGTS